MSTIDTSDLAPQFDAFYRSGTRIRVRSTYADGTVHERNGRVGKSTGWRPIYLLMGRSSDFGSWDTLRHSDEIIAVQDRSGRYFHNGVRVSAPSGHDFH